MANVAGIAMSSASMKRERVQITVNDLDESTRDVAFEGKVLTRYGTYDKLASQGGQSPGYVYLHCDLLDKLGYTTVTLSVTSPLVEQYEKMLQRGTFIRVENFGVRQKSNKGFEKGDMPVVIRVLSTTILTPLSPFQLELLPHFYHTDTIQEFRKRSHEPWASSTIAVVVVAVRGEFNRYKQLQVANGLGDLDHDIVAFVQHLHTEYEQIVQTFHGGHCVMVLLKNIAATTTGDRHLRTDHFTIVATVVDDATRQHLQHLHSNLAHAEVIGNLSVLSPSVPPFKRVCGDCRLTDFVASSDGDYFCNICRAKKPIVNIGFIRAKIFIPNQTTIAFLQGQWLESIVHMHESKFLASARDQQIKLLSNIHIEGRFKLIHASFLAGYEEQVQQQHSSPPQSSFPDAINPTPLSTVPSFFDVVATEVQPLLIRDPAVHTRSYCRSRSA